MNKLFKHAVGRAKNLLAGACLLVLSVPATAQQTTTVLPNNGSYSGQASPQGSLRYQRALYLVTPAELTRAGLTSGMSINSIGFTLGSAQSDTTKGKFKLYLQNSTDLVSRADTSWTTVNSTTNTYTANGLFQGDYEWQVQANCTANSPFTPISHFSNADIAGCNAPYNLTTTGITNNSATFNWETISSPVITEYQVEYSAIDAINWISATTTSTSYTATGLLAGKTYQWRVKTMCSTGTSAVNFSSFITTTTPVCNAVAGLTSTVTNDSLVAFAWTATAGASYYELQFRRTGTNSWSSASAFSNAVNLVLPAGTNYEWQVRAVCTAGSGAFTTGTSFNTGGTAVCYAPTNAITKEISGTSAKFSWSPVVGATGYTLRYRLKNTISWTNAITPMTLTCDSIITVPDTTGAYDIPFHGGSPFTYTGGSVYVAWEYSRAAGALPKSNMSLATTAGTSIQGVNGQDSVEYLLSFISRADVNQTALPTILIPTRQRPETRFGSAGLKDSVEVVAVYSLGSTIPAFQSPTPVSAVIKNYATTDKSYDVTLTVKHQQSNAVRYTSTQNVSIAAGGKKLVSFTGWNPALMETDSIIIAIPAYAGENVVENNRKSYLQEVNQNKLSYADAGLAIGATGLNEGAGLLLAKHAMKGCGKIISAQVYLGESSKNKSVYAVVCDATGAVVAKSSPFTPDSSQTNSYHSFYFPSPVSITNQDFYVGLAQPASTPGYYPIGVQWEDAQVRTGAYYTAKLDGTSLVDSPALGRLMIRAEIVPSGETPEITGNLSLCAGATNVLTAASVNSRFADTVIAYSSQNMAGAYSANQALGSPDVFPAHTLNPAAWTTVSPDAQREYLVLRFPNAAPINFVDIFETGNPGAVDTVFVKNASGNFVAVYSTTAAALPPIARRNRITFPTTAFNVSEIRIALNSPAVPGYNTIDAVSIGTITSPGTFSSYAWTPGGETTQTKPVTTAGEYKLRVTNASGCAYDAHVTVVSPVQITPVIMARGATTFCQGDSVWLRSTIKGGNTWNNGATTDSIKVKTAGIYTVSNNTGGCGQLTSAATTITINALPAVSISGITAICPGGNTTLDAGSFSSYKWSTGAVTQTIVVNAPGTYSVTASNANGCKATASVTTSMTTNPVPTISGTLAFCPGGSTTLDAGSGYTSYLWTSDGTTTQTKSVSAAGTYGVTVKNANGCSGSTSATVTVFTPPVPAITGKNGICSGGTTTLQATAGYTSYMWSDGSTTSSTSVTTVGNYSVTVTDNNGCTGTSATKSIVAFPAPTPVISGTLSFCGGSFTTLDAGAGFATYLWTTGAATRSISVTGVGTFGVTVTDNNGCSGSASVTTTTTSSVPATPGPITGNPTGICTGSTQVYSINPVANASLYEWTVPAGLSIISGQGTTSLTVKVGTFTSGNIVVAAANACGQSPSLNPRTLGLQSAPAVPGTITGQTTGVCGAVSKSYSVDAVPLATSYTWTAPAGATITSGQGSTSITVTFAASYISGNLCVKANSACAGSASSCIAVAGIPPAPGKISGIISVCSKQKGVVYSVQPVPGATTYAWTVPTQATITSGQGTSSIVVTFGTKTGSITVKATGACGSSTTSSVAVDMKCTGATNRMRLSRDELVTLVTKTTAFPNPSNGVFTLQLPNDFQSEQLSVKVLDIHGRNVYTHVSRSRGSSMLLNLAHLSKGMYMVQLSNDQKTEVIKILVQ
jgi:hypothetical protein